MTTIDTIFESAIITEPPEFGTRALISTEALQGFREDYSEVQERFSDDLLSDDRFTGVMNRVLDATASVDQTEEKSSVVELPIEDIADIALFYDEKYFGKRGIEFELIMEAFRNNRTYQPM